MTPEEEEAYEEALRRICEAEKTGALELDLSGLIALIRLPRELAGVTSLQSIVLRWSAIRPNGLRDLSSLAGLTSLQSLDLSGCRWLSDLSPLTSLTSLQSLDLSGCRWLSDLSPLTSLTSLQSLSLRRCGHLSVNLSPLTGLTSLQSLNLSGCELSDLSPLAGLTSLQSLNLSECNWRLDFRLLADLTSFQTFQLSSWYHFRRFAPLESLLPTLKKLVLFDCKFDDLPTEVCGQHLRENVLDKVRAHYEDLKSCLSFIIGSIAVHQWTLGCSAALVLSASYWSAAFSISASRASA
jgi:Leucine Rich repeats (2 copies)